MIRDIKTYDWEIFLGVAIFLTIGHFLNEFVLTLWGFIYYWVLMLVMFLIVRGVKTNE